MAIKLGPIGQIHMAVTDIARAVTFYRDVLRLPLLFESQERKMAFFDCGGIRLYVGEAEPGPDVSHPLLYFRVDDIDKAYRGFKRRGTPFERPPRLAHEGESEQLWLAFFRDPDGTLLALMEERAVLVAEK
ncbi:MAG: VOC family protein [Actinobacteria bacterium]|nr:VOC family protein [Actinomycetota bacterium]